MYQYLTGAASWYMMTMITEVFGICGKTGELMIRPRLLAEQFDEENKASLTVPFAGKLLTVIYENPQRKDYGEYRIRAAVCCQKACSTDHEGKDSFVMIPRKWLDELPEKAQTILVQLD